MRWTPNADLRRSDMCLAIPMELLTVQGEEGEVSRGGVSQRVCLALLPEAEVGDYVLVHAGYAIARVDAEEAEETRRLLATLLATPEATTAGTGSPSGTQGGTP